MGADEHVLEHRVLAEQRRRLERPRHASPADLRGTEPGDSRTLEEDLAGGERDDAGDQVEDSALAGAVGTDEAVDRAGLDRHREVRHGQQPTESPGDGGELKEQGRLPRAPRPVRATSAEGGARHLEAPRGLRARRAS